MQASRMLEIWVGVFVALGLLGLFFVAIEVSNLGEFRSTEGSYRIKAHFGNIGGLRVRAPVSMAGVTVGRVEKIGFDEQRYEAIVDIRVDPAFKKLPDDTSASILTAGLLGEQYIGLSAGGSDVYLGEGDEIELTQSAVVLEQLISRFLFNKKRGRGIPRPPRRQPPIRLKSPRSRTSKAWMPPRSLSRSLAIRVQRLRPITLQPS
jgi:phospholipid/cholesterol/gamma-HCH transport system substrate-binding protein